VAFFASIETMSILLLLALSAVCTFAQIRSVEIRVSGLDCASCAESVDRKLGRMRGVESARFDSARNVAALKLKDDNTVTMAAIRDALKSMGYTPEEANIVVHGDLRDGVLSMKHQEAAFEIDGASVSGSVIVEGSVAAGSNRLQARSVQPR
jgi:cation transport ATPase